MGGDFLNQLASLETVFEVQFLRKVDKLDRTIHCFQALADFKSVFIAN